MATPNPRQLQSREIPTGWPVGSFRTYAEAQGAVDALSDAEFPVEKLTIVGVDLMQVEKITGRLTWPRVLGGGALSGMWFGLFIGLLVGVFSPGDALWSILMMSLFIGAVFGVISVAVAYGFTGGKRDFSSATNIVAGHYDVLAEQDVAMRARDMIASMSRQSGQPQAQPEQGEH